MSSTSELLSAFFIKQGDSAPDAVFLLEDAEGNPIALTDAELVGTLRLRGEVEAPSVDFPLDIDFPATEGRCRHVWQSGETDAPGEYDLEIRILYESGEVQTVPSNGSPPRVVIVPHIEPAS